jgi:hypothetical protein
MILENCQVIYLISDTRSTTLRVKIIYIFEGINENVILGKKKVGKIMHIDQDDIAIVKFDSSISNIILKLGFGYKYFLNIFLITMEKI